MPSLYRTLRTTALAQTPSLVRSALRSLRDRAQRGDAQLRRMLPERLGGRYSDASIECRVLGPRDRPALQRLRDPGDPDTATIATYDLEAEAEFCVGVFVHGRLVGAGFCGDLSGNAPAFRSALFVADFIRPELRRRGLAQRLHLARLALLRNRGGELAFAFIDPSNRAARAALHATGFCETSLAHAAITLTPPSPSHRLLACRL